MNWSHPDKTWQIFLQEQIQKAKYVEDFKELTLNDIEDLENRMEESWAKDLISQTATYYRNFLRGNPNQIISEKAHNLAYRRIKQRRPKPITGSRAINFTYGMQIHQIGTQEKIANCLKAPATGRLRSEKARYEKNLIRLGYLSEDWRQLPLQETETLIRRMCDEKKRKRIFMNTAESVEIKKAKALIKEKFSADGVTFTEPEIDRLLSLKLHQEWPAYLHDFYLRYSRLILGTRSIGKHFSEATNECLYCQDEPHDIRDIFLECEFSKAIYGKIWPMKTIEEVVKIYSEDESEIQKIIITLQAIWAASIEKQTMTSVLTIVQARAKNLMYGS